MKTLLKATLLAATLGITAPLAAQAIPTATIVLVDMDKVFTTSAAGKQAQAELKTRADGIQARLQSLSTQFGAEEQALGKTQPQQGATPAVIAAWQAKVKDFQTRKAKEEQDLRKRDADFQASRQSVLKQINEAAQPIISTVMKERGANIVLAEGATLQHIAALDVTPDVVSRLDKSLPRVSTATPVAPAAK